MANNEMKDVENTSFDMAKDENGDDYTTSIVVKETELPGVKAKKENKRKRQLMQEAAQADNRGICYLSRIPPRMDHVKLRHLLSHDGEVQRIYLAPEDPAAHVKRKKAVGFRGEVFSEGWVEFTKRSVAKRVTEMLNSEQIGVWRLLANAVLSRQSGNKIYLEVKLSAEVNFQDHDSMGMDNNL